MIVFFIIVGVLLFLFFITSKIRKSILANDSFITQLKFMQLYMHDTTEKQFYNKDAESATQLGQDMLWQAAFDFHERMQAAIIDKRPLPIGDVTLLMSAIKIIKAAEAMVYIHNYGPIVDDEFLTKVEK